MVITFPQRHYRAGHTAPLLYRVSVLDPVHAPVPASVSSPCPGPQTAGVVSSQASSASQSCSTPPVAPPTDAHSPSGPQQRGGQGRGSSLARGSLGLHQSVSALLAIRGSRAPPSPAGLCVPESKMAVSRRRVPQAGARSFFCALLLSFSQFTGSDGTGGDAAAPGAAGTQAELPHRRFEYKYSFKGPHLVQSDGTVPFWAHAGSKPGLGRGAGSLLAFRLLGLSPQCPAVQRISSSPACHMHWGRTPQAAPSPGPPNRQVPRVFPSLPTQLVHPLPVFPSLISSVLSVWFRGVLLLSASPCTQTTFCVSCYLTP